jgi:hypothetical protein
MCTQSKYLLAAQGLPHRHPIGVPTPLVPRLLLPPNIAF